MFWAQDAKMETATMQMNEVGFGTGMVTGGLASIAVAAGNDIARAIHDRRITAAFQRWEEALAGERAARRQAEQRAAVLRTENKALRAALARAQLESKILQAAA
jgi:hypothetical protein